MGKVVDPIPQEGGSRLSIKKGREGSRGRKKIYRGKSHALRKETEITRIRIRIRKECMFFLEQSGKRKQTKKN